MSSINYQQIHGFLGRKYQEPQFRDIPGKNVDDILRDFAREERGFDVF
jgi:hypothetical protein